MIEIGIEEKMINMIDNVLFFTLSCFYLNNFECYYLHIFIFFRICTFHCDSLLALFGFMGRHTDFQFIVFLHFLEIFQYFTLFI